MPQQVVGTAITNCIFSLGGAPSTFIPTPRPILEQLADQRCHHRQHPVHQHRAVPDVLLAEQSCFHRGHVRGARRADAGAVHAGHAGAMGARRAERADRQYSGPRQHLHADVCPRGRHQHRVSGSSHAQRSLTHHLMTWHNKVMWTEGMFLQPQHFQQHDRLPRPASAERLAATSAYGWGLRLARARRGRAGARQDRVSAAHGVMPDGTAFSSPGHDAGAARRSMCRPTRATSASCSRSRCSAPASSRSDAEAGDGSMPPRYRVAEVDVGDTNATSSARRRCRSAA